MKVAVTSTVIFEVADDQPIDVVRQKFYEANVWAIGNPMVAVGNPPLLYVMTKIERLEVEKR